MKVPSIAFVGCPRPLQGRQIQQPLLKIFRRSSSTAKATEVDFLALEAEWHDKWKNRKGGIEDCGIWNEGHYPLAPLYCKHLRTPTILEALAWYSTPEARRRLDGGCNNMMSLSLELAKSGKFDDPSGHPDKGIDLETSIARYGTDVTRTYIIFAYLDSPTYCEEDIGGIQQGLQSVWKATLLASKSYAVTQGSTPMAPKIADALDEPNLDTHLDSITDMPRSLVYTTPEYPNIFDMNELDCKLWLAAQKALKSWTQHTSIKKSLKPKLDDFAALTNAVIKYDGFPGKLPSLHYHSARIMLCLVAPLAPAFAEECWVLLHYGSDSPPAGESKKQLEGGLSEQDIQEELAKKGNEELRYLPRRGRPETLPSIFDHPIPTPEPKETMALLKNPSLRLKASRVREEKEQKRMMTEYVARLAEGPFA